MPWAINERHMSNEEQLRFTYGALGRVLLLRPERLEAVGWLTSWTLVQLRIRITQLNGNVSEAFLVVAHGLLRISQMSVITLTPEMARTRVDLPWATWPMVPILMVA